jgi:hypothetical protein
MVMKTTLTKKIFQFVLLLACGVNLSACGEESSSEDAGFEKALFVAYAAAQPTEHLYAIMITSPQAVATTLISTLSTYYITYAAGHEGNAPSPFDLSNPPVGVDIPAGITGIIYTTTTDTLYRIELSNSYLDFAGYSNTLGSYSGRMKFGGETADKMGFDINKETLNPINLIINFTGQDYQKATFTNFSYALDSTGTYPTWTLNGSLVVDGNGYSFTNLTVTVSGVNTLTISGILSFDGDDYDVSGSVTFNSSGIWVGGTLTITANDTDTVDVAFSESGATFTKGEDTWEKATWWDDRLAP